MSERIRVFISVDIPVTDEIKGLMDDLKTVDNVRPSPLSQIHITLKFLGDTYADKIPKLTSKLREALRDTDSFELVMKGVGAFPKIRDPRVIWIGFEESEKLMSLAKIVEDTLSSMKLDFDEKRFSPHVTVGRVNGKADISGIVSKHKDTEFCRFTCDCINIMKSELSPKGAKHTVLERIELTH